MKKQLTKDQKKLSGILFVVFATIVLFVLIISTIIFNPQFNFNPFQKNEEVKNIKKDNNTSDTNDQRENDKRWIKARFNVEFRTMNNKYSHIIKKAVGSTDSYNRELMFMMYDTDHTINFNISISETKEGLPVSENKIKVLNSSPIIKLNGITQADLGIVFESVEKHYYVVDLGAGRVLNQNEKEYSTKINFFNVYGEAWKGRAIKTQIDFLLEKNVDATEMTDLIKSLKLLDEIPKEAN